MIELSIDNSFSQVTGLSIDQMKKLRKLMSYEADPQSAYFSGGFARTKYLIDKNGHFPTGLVYLIQKFLYDVPFSVNDIRQAPDYQGRLFDLRLHLTPYQDQINAATACVEAHRGIVSAPTGSGKSLIIALIISRLQCRTLVVVPTLEIKRQLLDSLSSAFGAEKVGPFSDNKPIAIENIAALDPKEVCTYDCVIVDEIHHSAARTYRLLNERAWCGVYYRFGLSASPFRANDNERLLFESFLSQVIYRLSHGEAVQKGYIVPAEFYYLDVPKSTTDGYSWAEVYSDLVVRNEGRNAIIADLLKSLYSQGKSTLCLVKEIAHGNILSDLTGAAFANGQSEDCGELIKWFSEGKLKTLIGTAGVLGEGVDTRAAEYVVIAGLGKSKPAFMQQCGRGFRRYPGKESCKVVIFKDNSHKWTKAHFYAQSKFVKEEYGVVAQKIEIS